MENVLNKIESPRTYCLEIMKRINEYFISSELKKATERRIDENDNTITETMYKVELHLHRNDLTEELLLDLQPHWNLLLLENKVYCMRIPKESQFISIKASFYIDHPYIEKVWRNEDEVVILITSAHEVMYDAVCNTCREDEPWWN